jgi:hypothetical protein
MLHKFNTEVVLKISELLREEHIRAHIKGENLKIGQFLRLIISLTNKCTSIIAIFKDGT